MSFLEINETIEFTEQAKGAYRIPKNEISRKVIENPTIRNIATRLIPTVTRQKIGDKLLLKQTDKPLMSPNEKQRLKKIYEDEVREVEKLLGKNLPWDDFK